jgi:3-oxoacyl-[acyl-carrier-protein] synthase II
MSGMHRRIVITGSGALSPFGVGVEVLWESLLMDRNGISFLDKRIFTDEIVGIGAMLPKIESREFHQSDSIIREKRLEDQDVKSFFLAVNEAVSQAGLEFNKMDDYELERTGTFIADRHMNPIRYIDRYAPYIHASLDMHNNFLAHKFDTLLESTPAVPFHEFDDSCSISHLTARVYGIQGPYLNIATACASSNSAIQEASERIKSGEIDKAIVGGGFNLDLAGMIGFSRLGALSSNPNPDSASRPFDAERDGFVMGSGCAILILEELEHAQIRGAEILCEVAGYGTAIDAFRATDPEPQASSAVRAMKESMKMAKINPVDVDYINAHGTSTQVNDMTETLAIKKVMGNESHRIPISSTKSMIGHSILAAAAFEAIVCIKSIRDKLIHGTRNWRNRDPELDLDYVPDGAREMKVNCALSNSFGFGGVNTCVAFKRFQK